MKIFSELIRRRQGRRERVEGQFVPLRTGCTGSEEQSYESSRDGRHTNDYKISNQNGLEKREGTMVQPRHLVQFPAGEVWQPQAHQWPPNREGRNDAHGRGSSYSQGSEGKKQ
ncbi:hypothetical protein N8T08_005432 [Aspergillus melleus]|uniref:Uncharacterized protein n=1 Tax=Aspergillus melleus TaxID=138277 RepID=A0ACC3B2E0_9EURO|nr:hypothetical protein N8T08_005432 [Aspergillus melleus]